MDISRINNVPALMLNESDESASKKKKVKKEEQDSVVASLHHHDAIVEKLTQYPMPKLPDLNAIREKILNHDYQIDYEQLAKKIMQLDENL